MRKGLASSSRRNATPRARLSPSFRHAVGDSRRAAGRGIQSEPPMRPSDDLRGTEDQIADRAPAQLAVSTPKAVRRQQLAEGAPIRAQVMRRTCSLWCTNVLHKAAKEVQRSCVRNTSETAAVRNTRDRPRPRRPVQYHTKNSSEAARRSSKCQKPLARAQRHPLPSFDSLVLYIGSGQIHDHLLLPPRRRMSAVPSA